MNLMDNVQEYLAVRRAFGAKLKGFDRSLCQFVAFLKKKRAPFVTTQLALQWATQPCGVSKAHHVARLRWVRLLTGFLHTKDPRHEVPPVGLLCARPRRITPYVYSDVELAQLLERARQRPSPLGLQGETYATMFALLMVTGMRMNEVISLEREDVDLTGGVLTIRETKFHKTRMIPIHPTTATALSDYAQRRDSLVRGGRDRAFFVSEKGSRMSQDLLRGQFKKLCQTVGLRDRTDGRGPRLHDLRHRFAVQSLVHWYRQDLDAARLLPILSTYLGHACTADTYWYLEAVPELLELATRRLERAIEERL